MNYKIISTLKNGKYPLSDFIPELNPNLYKKKKDRQNIDDIISLIISVSFKHHMHFAFENCYDFSQELLYKVFKQGYYRRCISRNENHVFNKLFFRIHIGNNMDNLGDSAYTTTKYFENGINSWLLANRYEEEAALEISYNTEGDAYDITSHVKINIKSIKSQLQKNYDLLEVENEKINVYGLRIDKYRALKKKIIDIRADIFTLKSYLAFAENGIVELRYKTSASGRYYGVGAIHLQSKSKKLREVILHGYYSYDMESACQVILSQLYFNISSNKVPQGIQDYIDNKLGYRVSLALYLDVDIDTAKMIYTMLFFGARVTKNPHPTKNALAKQIGVDKVNKLIQQPVFMALVNDINTVFKVIADYYKLNHMEKIGDSLIVTNPKGQEMRIDTWDNGRVIAHVYQGVEAMVLDTCIEFYRSKYTDARYLLIHDGFYSEHELYVSELENFVYEKTGYKIHFTPRAGTIEVIDMLNLFGIYDQAVALMNTDSRAKKIA